MFDHGQDVKSSKCHRPPQTKANTSFPRISGPSRGVQTSSTSRNHTSKTLTTISWSNINMKSKRIIEEESDESEEAEFDAELSEDNDDDDDEEDFVEEESPQKNTRKSRGKASNHTKRKTLISDDDNDDDDDDESDDDFEQSVRKKAKKSSSASKHKPATKLTSPKKSKVKIEREPKPDRVVSSNVKPEKVKKIKELDTADRLNAAMQSFLWWEAPPLQEGYLWNKLEHAGVVSISSFLSVIFPLVSEKQSIFIRSHFQTNMNLMGSS